MTKRKEGKRRNTIGIQHTLRSQPGSSFMVFPCLQKIEFNFDSSLPHTFSWEDLVQITRTFHHLPISDEFKSALELFSMSTGNPTTKIIEIWLNC